MAVLAMLALIAGCAFPTYDQSKLKAVRAEAMVLMATYPIDPKKGWADVPRDRLPPAIASLRPEFVLVDKRSVTIVTKPYFDGGWGYEIPRRGRRDLKRPQCGYWEPGPGVFWYGPC